MELPRQHVDPNLSKNNQNARGKSNVPYLDALDAGFAVVAFDVDFNFGVANEAETQTKEQICWIKRLQVGF